MDQRTQGTITKAIADGPAENRDLIVERADQLFRRLWLAIAAQNWPAARRRSADPEDAVQETLRELDRELQKPNCKFKTSDCVKKWGARATACNSIDMLSKETKNGKLEGPSALTQGNNGNGLNATDLLAQYAIADRVTDVPHDQQIRESNITARTATLSHMVESSLNSLTPHEQSIVTKWLDNRPYRQIASALNCTTRDVRNTTFDFMLQFQAVISAIRDEIACCETEYPGVAMRISFEGRTSRLLLDFREQP